MLVEYKEETYKHVEKKYQTDLLIWSRNYGVRS